MSELFEPSDDLESMVALTTEPAPFAAGSVEVYTEREYEDIAGCSGLGLGLAQITSRLLRQLATGGERFPFRGAENAGDAQIDARSDRPPDGGGTLVPWRRVVVVSTTGRVLALVSLPDRSGTP